MKRSIVALLLAAAALLGATATATAADSGSSVDAKQLGFDWN